MNQYIFIFGTNPALSYAELISVLSTRKKDFKVLESDACGAIIETSEIIRPDFMYRLGGTIKIGRILDFGLEKKDIYDYIAKNIGEEKKINFGFSIYKWNFRVSREKIKRLSIRSKKLGLEIKKDLKNKDLGCRLVVGKDPILSSVIVKKNNLLEKGFEFMFVVGEHSCMARTIAVQEFEDFSLRDYGRPARDVKSGMLPPKLARIMINLTDQDVEAHTSLLDPFCGSGTVLLEALLMGFTDVLCTDIEAKAVADSKINYRWFLEQYPHYKERNLNVRIEKMDATKIFGKYLGEEIQSIVTEPYLGPPVTKTLSKDEALSITQKVETMYVKAVKELARIIKKGGSAVFALPVLYTGKWMFGPEILRDRGGEFVFVNIKKIFLNNGFKPVKLIGNPDAIDLDFYMKEKGTIIYGRPQQKVLREICKFVKV